MRRINYQSDFDLTERMKGADPTVPFRFSYFTTDASAPFAASFDGKVYVNCERYDDEKVIVHFNNHGFRCGVLYGIYEFDLANEAFADGQLNMKSKQETGIILVSGASSTCYDLEHIQTPFYQKGDKGESPKISDKGTWMVYDNDKRMYVDTGISASASGDIDLSGYYKSEQVDTLLNDKVEKVAGKGLSANDYTDLEKEKLSGLDNYDDSKVVKSITINGSTKVPVAGDVNLDDIAGNVEVVNNLTSDSTTSALSAAQGKELKRLIDEIPTGGGGTGGSVALDTTMPETPTDTKAPSTKLFKQEVDRLGQKMGNVMTVDQRITYDKIKRGIKGIGITALGDGVIKINNVEKQLSAGYNELLIDGIFSIESIASDRNILSIDWISTNVDITRLTFNGAELLHKLNTSFCIFNSVNINIIAKSLTEIDLETCIFNGISSIRLSVCDSMYSAKINAKIKMNSLQNFFTGRSYLLKDLCISNFDTSDCTSFQYAFFRLDKLERLDLSGIDTSKVDNFGYAFEGSSMQLKDFLAPKPNACKANVSFGQCANLTVDATYSKPSVDGIIDWLYDYVSAGEETSNVITFHSAVKSKLSQTQTERITNKGWTIA